MMLADTDTAQLEADLEPECAATHELVASLRETLTYRNSEIGELERDNSTLLDLNAGLRRQIADYKNLKRAMGALRTTINELLGDA